MNARTADVSRQTAETRITVAQISAQATLSKQQMDAANAFERDESSEITGAM